MSQVIPELIGIRYSPWTEKARWALDHHGFNYRYSEHLILLGMPALRLKTGKLTGDLTVPILIDGEKKFFDSFDIALHADQWAEAGRSAKLFPPTQNERFNRIKYYNDLSERALDAGRALLVSKIPKNRQAVRENIPSFLPQFLRPACTPLVSIGLKYIAHEFDIGSSESKKSAEEFSSILATIDADLTKSASGYLLGDFSYADVAIAAALQLLKPVSNDYVRIGDGMRACMTEDTLSHQFSDLVRWRDSIYERHRPKAKKRTHSHANHSSDIKSSHFVL